MSFTVAAGQILTLFIILVVGVVARKLDIINEAVNKKLSIILLYITSPSLIFTSFMGDFDSKKLINAGFVAIGAMVGFFVSILLAEIIWYRFLKEKEDGSLPVMKASAVFSNCGYMGFPLIYSVYGEEGVFYASIYVVIFQILIWTYGVIIFSGERKVKDLKRVLISPALIAVIVSFIVYILRVPMPFPIQNSAEMVGGMTTPLAMLIIGAIMAKAKPRELINDWRIYYVSILRLIIVPGILLVLSKLLPFPEVAARIVVIALAMPVAVNVAVFAESFDKEPVLASKIVAMSTFLSIITIPIFFTMV